MRRFVVMLLATTLAAQAVWAQQKPLVPMTAVSQRGKLSGKKQVMYLLRQLDLTAPQRRHAQGLIEAILDAGDPQLSLDQVYQLMAEIQEAEADGEESRKKELELQLRQLGKGSNRAQTEFFENMELELTDEQKAALSAARARLKRNASGALRPVDIFRLLPQLNPTSEQQATFDRMRTTLRRAVHEIKTLKDKERFQLMNGLLDSIRKQLTPEQQKKFDLGIRRLRPDLASRLRVKLRGTPAGEEKGAETNPEVHEETDEQVHEEVDKPDKD